jgi:hypothetical protein
MDPIATQWQLLAQATVAGPPDALAASLAAIAAELPPPPSRTARVSQVDKARIFFRDSFTCRHCERETIFEPVFRVLALLHPAGVPYDDHWRRVACHPDVMTHATSLDHVLPVSRGGTNDWENLVTACAGCQYRKMDDIWPDPRPVATSTWDGLSGLYPELCQLAELVPASDGADPTEVRHHSSWLRALSQAKGG